MKVRKRAKIMNRYNLAPHLTQDTNEKVTTSQIDITNESQEVSPFPAGDHKASINRRARKHNKNKTEKNGISFKCDRGPIFQVTNTEISHSLGLQKSTANQIRLNEIVVLGM